MKKELQQILDKVYKNYDIGSDPILGPFRFNQLVEIRKVIWYILFTQHGWSMRKIGKAFTRDHSTISRGVHTVLNNKRKYVRMISKLK